MNIHFEQKQKNSLKLSYIVFAMLLLILHSFIMTGTNDDAWFAEMLDKYNLLEYLQMRYNVWTSRIFIETGEVYLTRINPWIWKFINISVFIALVYECIEIWGKYNKVINTILFMSLIPLLPMNMLSSAGWISTTLNYLWPITAGIFTILLLYKHFQKKHISVIEYVVGCITCLYSCCQEQVVAVLFTVYMLGGFIYKIHRRKLPLIWWIFWIMSIGFLIFILTCPGNVNRSVIETNTWFPEYKNVTLLNKLLIGFLNTFSYFISCGEYNTIFLLFSYVLALLVWGNTEKKVGKVIAFYPFSIALLWGFLARVIMKSKLPIGKYWIGLLQNEYLPEFSAYSVEHIWIECSVFVSVIAVITYLLFVSFGKSLEFLQAIIILFAGLCSRMIIGLSPTVYVSGARTATLGHVCFMILIFICIQKGASKKGDKKIILYCSPVYFFSLITTVLLNLQ